MAKTKAWSTPGWPWELEIPTIIFALAAISAPLYVNSLFHVEAPPAILLSSVPHNAAAQSLQQQYGILWGVGIIGLYILHFVFSLGSVTNISTPFSSIASPTVFAALAYYRVHDVATDAGRNVAVMTNSVGQIILGFTMVILFSLLLARLRMARQLLHYRDEKWDMVSPAKYDSSYFELIAQMNPLIYPPRVYRASENGILIEGWYYFIPVLHSETHSISAVSKAVLATRGHYLASSAHNLIRMELADSQTPVFISPTDREGFLKYCAHFIARHRPPTHSGTRPGTNNHGTHGSRLYSAQTAASHKPPTAS